MAQTAPITRAAESEAVMGSLPRGISGSRAAAILGVSPWATSFQVWQAIMEDRQPGFNAARKYDYEAFDGNASTRWGLAFEDAVIKLAEDRGHNGNHHITDREREFVLGAHGSSYGPGYITCHIDGMYQFNPRVLHEGKTTTSYGFGDKWGEPGTDRIPIEYQIQTQHQMLCTGADECIVSVLVFPKRPDEWEEMNLSPEGHYNDDDSIRLKSENQSKHYGYISMWADALAQMGFFHQYTVKADPELHALMLDKYRVWWTKYVIGETPPAPANYADIRALITEPVGTIIVDSQTARWFKEYKDIGGEIGSTGNLAKRREQLKTLILEHARDMEKTLDDESSDKWVFRDDRGNKLGSYSKNNNGSMVFR